MMIKTTMSTPKPTIISLKQMQVEKILLSIMSKSFKLYELVTMSMGTLKTNKVAITNIKPANMKIRVLTW